MKRPLLSKSKAGSPDNMIMKFSNLFGWWIAGLKLSNGPMVLRMGAEGASGGGAASELALLSVRNHHSLRGEEKDIEKWRRESKREMMPCQLGDGRLPKARRGS